MHTPLAFQVAFQKLSCFLFLLRNSSSAAYLCPGSRFIRFASLPLRGKHYFTHFSRFHATRLLYKASLLVTSATDGRQLFFLPLLHRCFKKQNKPSIFRVCNIAAQPIHFVNLSLCSTSVQLASATSTFVPVAFTAHSNSNILCELLINTFA